MKIGTSGLGSLVPPFPTPLRVGGIGRKAARDIYKSGKHR
jgi:hypothetical protein